MNGNVWKWMIEFGALYSSVQSSNLFHMGLLSVQIYLIFEWFIVINILHIYNDYYDNQADLY